MAAGLSKLLRDAPEEDEAEEETESEDESGDYEVFAKEAFPDEEWTPERLSALKELVMSCMEK